MNNRKKKLLNKDLYMKRHKELEFKRLLITQTLKKMDVEKERKKNLKIDSKTTTKPPSRFKFPKMKMIKE